MRYRKTVRAEVQSSLWGYRGFPLWLISTDLDFRVYQCPQFLQHKCTQHRPFTCFNWHFQNQRRRQPVQRADKSFNYSPDIYCNQWGRTLQGQLLKLPRYDETTGTCKKGDECPFLHRVTGDTERRYHLRYYKVFFCISRLKITFWRPRLVFMKPMIIATARKTAPTAHLATVTMI